MNSERGASVFRRLRWTFVALLFLVLYFFVFARFVYQRIENESALAMAGALKIGERHLIEREPAEELARDWVVAFVLPGNEIGWSRVRGIPGDRIRMSEKRIELEGVDGDRHRLDPRITVPGELLDTVIPEGSYLLFNDVLDAPYPDSRFLGLVSRSRILHRMVFHFGSGNG